MQNLKQHGDLNVQEGLGVPTLCSLEQKISWRLSQKEMHFLFMFFLRQMLHVHMKFLPNTKNSNMCLRRKIHTHYQNIDHMTSPLVLWKGHNFHLDPSIIYHKINLQRFVYTSMKTWRRGSFDISSLQLVPWSYLSRRKMAPFECVSITMGLINPPSRINTFYPWSKGCWTNSIMLRCTPRLIYVEHTTWCTFEKAMNGRRRLEPVTTILNMLWCHLAL
jgi:hypothetical protein